MQDYFQNLNYTVGNEDTKLEFDALPSNASHVVSIAGSGSRILPFLAKAPREITAVDISPLQLSLLKLRLTSMQACSYAEYLSFWGFPQLAEAEVLSPNSRKNLFYSLPLEAGDRKALIPSFENSGWDSILLEGRWEKTFVTLSKIVRLVLGEKWIEQFFEVNDEAEYARWMENKFPHLRWKLILTLVANSKVFNALLYRGNFPGKNISQGYLEFYLSAFSRLFAQGPAQRNYFLQLCFFGKLKYATGLPFDAEEGIFHQAKQNVGKIKFNFVSGDLVQHLGQLSNPSDFVSLSDVPSYFKGDLEKNFMQKIRPGLSMGAKVVLRNYLRIPESLDLSGYREVTKNYEGEIARERFQMYDIHFYEKVENGSK